MKWQTVGTIARRAGAFLLGALAFPVYVILVAQFDWVEKPWYHPPWYSTKWVFMLFHESDWYVLGVLVTLASAVVLSALLVRLCSARTAAWFLAGFIAASTLRDVEFLILARQNVNFTVWAPLVGVAAGWVLGRYLKLKRHVADAPAASFM